MGWHLANDATEPNNLKHFSKTAKQDLSDAMHLNILYELLLKFHVINRK